MKTKKSSKKLNINKTTVANLNNVDMKKLRGGGTYTCETSTICTQSDMTGEDSDCPGCTHTCPCNLKDPVIPTE